MSKKSQDGFVAVPVQGSHLHPSIAWDVSVSDVNKLGDNYQVTLFFPDRENLLELATLCLELYRDNYSPIKLQGKISAENLQFEAMTEEEAEVFDKRYHERQVRK